MLRPRGRRRRQQQAVELNITAFMNLMVILVPFLLITAVFSRLAILELQLAEASDAPPPVEQPEEPELQLEIQVRHNALLVTDRRKGILENLQRSEGLQGLEGYDFVGLGEFLQELKTQHPDKEDATILMEPEVPYEVLVAVMDAVRAVSDHDEQGLIREALLFPKITLGDAPAADHAGGAP